MNIDDLLHQDRVGYLNSQHAQCIYYSPSTSNEVDIQVRIADNLGIDSVLLQPEEALQLLAWLEEERETLEALAKERRKKTSTAQEDWRKNTFPGESIP